MDSVTSTTVLDQATTTARKELRAKLGQMSGPIPATKVFSKTQEHDFNGQKAVSWVVITPDNKVVKATTYSGNLGAKFHLGEHNTTALPQEGSKEARKVTKGYEEVAVTDCPFAIEA